MAEKWFATVIGPTQRCTRCFIKGPLFVFHNSLKWWSLATADKNFMCIVHHWVNYEKKHSQIIFDDSLVAVFTVRGSYVQSDEFWRPTLSTMCQLVAENPSTCTQLLVVTLPYQRHTQSATVFAASPSQDRPRGTCCRHLFAAVICHSLSGVN